MGGSRRWRSSPLLITAFGIVLFCSAVIHHSIELYTIESQVGPLAALIVDGLPALGVAYAGHWVSKTDTPPETQRTVVHWSFAGAALLVALVGVTFLIRLFEGRSLAEPQFVFLIAAETGALAGLTTGFYKARAELDAEQERRTSQRLQEANRQLEASNERLEQFAHVLSHDLQEPLRMISGYLHLLDDRYADELDQDAREFIEYSVDGADRMQAMIESLLEYSRVGTHGNPMEPTDAEAVLDDVRRDLHLRIEETDATITADDLPRVHADPHQLAEVFRNFLGNALEHTGDEPPRIHVGAERTGDVWRFSIRDEGIGIDPENQDRIFQMFEQVNTADGDAGTSGIGLALCERIIERHGGDIWVESEPGAGATFSFTLPVVPDDERTQSP